jgi:hypothetical protein
MEGQPMTENHKKVFAKVVLAVLSFTIVEFFTVTGFAQEKIRLSYSALSPSTAFLWIPKE